MNKLTYEIAKNPKSKLEKFYRDILESYEGSVFVTDEVGNIIFCTTKYGHFLGVGEEYLSKGKTIDDFIKDGLVSETATSEVLQTLKPNAKYIIASQTGVPMLVMSKPLFDDMGKLKAVITYSTSESINQRVSNQFIEEKKKYQGTLKILSSQTEKGAVVISKNAKMSELLKLVNQVAASNSTVLLQGESGTGKEVIARHIHKNSQRAKETFIPVNCAAIPTELMEAEFFGYERGAFTGANRDGKSGLFELANKGTLFLDEIGELPLTLQAKLLRAIESGEIRRVGGSSIINTDARIIAATNVNLKEAIRQKTFRADLFYRINIFPIKIPPLRERKEDIVQLAKVFLDEFNLLHRSNCTLSEIALCALSDYSWPGNVRELRNVIERMVITSGVLPSDIFSAEYKEEQNEDLRNEIKEMPVPRGLGLKEAIGKFEYQYIQNALNIHKGDVSKAAKDLKMPVSTLYQKIRIFKNSE